MSSLNVSIYADASQAIEAFGKLKDRTTDLEKGFNKIGKAFSNFGSLATKSLTVPIVASTTAMGLASKKAIEFDNGMREVLTLLPELGNESFEKLKNQALSFSKDIGKAPEETVKALYQALSAGIPRENVFEFLKTAGEASIAGVSDLRTSVDGLTSVTNAYGSEILNAQKASDIMFQTVKLGKTDFTQLSNNLYNVIPIASAIGVQFEDIGAAIAAMTAQGVPTSVATTQMKQALSDLNKEGSVTYEAFKQISGESFKDFIAGGGNLQEALQMMSDYAEKTGKEVTSMFTSVDAGNAVLALSGKNASKFKDYLDQVRNSVGATSEAFKKIDDGAARQFERLKAELSALVIELGNNALPLINESFIPLFRDTLVPIIDDAIKTISSLIKAFNNLPAPLQATTVGIIGITAGLGPALQGIGSLRKSFVETKKIINDFKGAIGSLKTSVSSIQALSTVWKGFNTVVLASPVGVVTALTAGLGALALKAYKLNQEYKQLIESSQKLTSSTKELNDNAFKDLGLFQEYQKLASSKELDAAATERLNQVTEKLTRLYPNLKTVVLDGITYIDSATMKLEDYRTAEEATNIQTIESTIKELEKQRKIYQKALEGWKQSLYAIGADDNYIQRELDLGNSSDYNELKKVEDTLAKLEKQRNDLNQNMQLRQSLTRDGIDLETKEQKANQKSIDAIKKKSDTVKEHTKTYEDYLKELKKAEEDETRRVKNLNALGAEISDADALESKKNKVSSILTEMSTALNLNANQIKYLSKNYGYAFDSIKTDRFDELVKEIENSITAYERNVEVAEEFGEKISEAEREGAKSEIVRSGIESITNEIKLTNEQVEILKQKFGDLWKVNTLDFSSYFASNWSNMFNDVADNMSDLYTAVQDLKIQAIEFEIDKTEERKELALKAIEEEKAARLEALGIMENSQKQSLLNEIKQLKNRQNVALGLYEQERIKAELEEKQKELSKIQIEEEAKAKQLEIEKNYNNEKMRLEYNSRLENWKMSLAQGTSSMAQAAINALASAMAVPFPANLVAYATLLGVIASGSVNLATLSQAKPQEPKYLARGGVVERRHGGINAVIGEGANDEAVIPLEDKILSKIGSSIFEATANNDQSYSVKDASDVSYNQPIHLILDGKIVAATMLNLSKRGVKVVSQRGIL
ncbi:phage tail tape measure protein [Brachyspira pilosicoli]|uniref:phage tail tape measure protein n=1 Tax=Brachyspira pilosicoli TaxID=52584 RepID=UPI000E14D127|nr:phage tail tape measure protein [Brachyspira pilosicoli]SUW04301.1 phage tail tape measure protein [Brachyspira pilosicoli]SUW07966.1 phage tail tape measure protein [Brachyspira pilosicoli]